MVKRLRSNVSVIMLDIDGTIKDLVKENTDALIYTMRYMNRVDLKRRGKFVLWINKLVMYFIKTGFLPTNGFMQSILLMLYAIVLLKKYSEFKEIYFEKYNREHIFFSGVNEMLKELHDKGKKVYLVTKNPQNINMLKNSNIKGINNIIIGKQGKIKYYTYKALIHDLNIDKEELIIIGDNFWDDVISALVLGVNVIWCNMYSCKLKKLAINFLSIINKKCYQMMMLE